MLIPMELFSVLSRFLNVLSGGTADMTLSARSHRDALKIEQVIDWFFWKLFKEKNHCENWWLIEVKRSRATLEWLRTASSCEKCRNLEDIHYV